MLLLVLTIAYMIYSNILQSEYQVSDLDCDSTDQITEEEVNEVSSLFDCFCYQKLISLSKLASLSSYSFEIDGETTTCQDWLSDLVLRYSLFYGNVVIIFILNYCNDIISRFLSIFEAHNNVNEMDSSNMLKSFFFKLFNTAFLVLIINCRVSFEYGSNNMFLGDYDELTVNWFLSIGLSILLTIFWETVLYPFTHVIYALLIKLKRCLDRGCSRNPRKTKRKLQTEYEALYTDSPFFMVTYLTRAVVIIWIGLFYCSGMPFMFFLVAFYLFILFWTTKIKLLCFSAKPPFTGLSMQKRAREIIEWGILFHMILAFWIFGNKYIIIDGQINLEISKYFSEFSIPEWKGIFLYVVRFLEKVFGRDISLFTLLTFFVIGVLIFLRFGLFEVVRLLNSLFFSCLESCGRKRKEQKHVSLYDSCLSNLEVKEELLLLKQMLKNKGNNQSYILNDFLKKKYQERVNALEKANGLIEPSNKGAKYRGLHTYNFMVRTHD